MDLPETRELLYFVAVAEELHFGRAAQRLEITQPPLSRTIKRLERRLGTALFTRTSRHVALTPAGVALLDDARAALQAMTAAAHRAQRAGRPQRRLTLAMKPGGDAGLLPAILAAYRSERNAVPIDIVFSFGDRAQLVHSGVADAALLHSPRNDLSGLATEALVTEQQIVLLPRDHRLAHASQLRMDDLRGEQMPRWPGVADDGSTGPLISDAGQLIQLITLKQVVAVLPASVAASIGGDIVAVPVVDAPPTVLVLGWPEECRSAELALFVRVATEVADRNSSPQSVLAADQSGREESDAGLQASPR